MISRIKIFIGFCFKEILDLMYKRKCIHCACSIQDGILCKRCLKTVQNLSFFQQAIINGYKVYSAFYYEGVIKDLIHGLKFNHKRNFAYFTAEFLVDYIDKIKDEEFLPKNTVIIPVLTHKKNINSRGYDNVLEIAKQLALITGYELNTTCLKKVKFTKPQFKLTAKQRHNNILGSFELDKNFNTDKKIILLDDIFTTGSTLEFITSLFKEKGVKNLICLTLSKTKLDKKSFKQN